MFFDTTFIYIEDGGGKIPGQEGFSRITGQMFVSAVIDDNGIPICCEMWHGNTTGV
jgi:hypothetical protein